MSWLKISWNWVHSTQTAQILQIYTDKEMEKDKKQIELRSEKVRNIIGQVPPVLLRYGISIIGLAICVLVGISAIIPYQPSIDTELEIRQDDADKIHFTVNIRENKIKDFDLFSSVLCERASELALPSVYKIRSVSDSLQLSNNDAWYKAEVFPEDTASVSVNLEDNPVVFPAKIVLKRKSLLMWVVDKVVE